MTSDNSLFPTSPGVRHPAGFARPAATGGGCDAPGAAAWAVNAPAQRIDGASAAAARKPTPAEQSPGQGRRSASVPQSAATRRAAGTAPGADASGATFSMGQARTILGTDLRPRAAVYWFDFLASWCVAIGSFKLVQVGSVGTPLRAAAFVASVLAIYRAALFIHELAHLPEREFRVFRFVWNLLAGIPFLIPSFVYQTHVDHHRRKHYGTSHDGEYLPFGSRPAWRMLEYLGHSFLIPILAILRFGVLTPLTWMHGPIRSWVLRHASSMVIDYRYLRPLPTKKQLRVIRWQEVACFLFVAVMAFGIVRSWFGQGVLWPWLLPQAYATGVSVLTLNALRTLGAHRYGNDPTANGDQPMTFVEQLLDSVNYPRHPVLTTLWAPVGTRFHALHHLFPSMPYHVMPEAHRRLMAGLPADSPYRRTESPGLVAQLAELWRVARESQRKHAA